MDPVEDENAHLYPTLHPLKLFDAAKSQGRYLYACAPMVRYSKLAFRQTVHHYGTDLCWTPMILAKEFNRSAVAREADLSISTREGGPRARVPTVAQFGACSALELARASSLAAPYVSGVDLNCGCPQSWACAESLGAALMDRRELVRDMVVETRSRLARDGWAVGLADEDLESARGRSVTVKIRVHKDLRQTMDFIDTVLADDGGCGWKRNIDWLTIHPRTRKTPSSLPIDLEALEILTEKYGKRVPILVSGDVFTLRTLPYTSHLLDENNHTPTFTSSTDPTAAPSSSPSNPGPLHLPNLAGLMSARALLANPALFAGHETCPWEAVDVFLANLARVPLILKSSVHHLTEMLGPGYGPDKRALVGKRDRMRLTKCGNWIDVLDLLEELRAKAGAATAEEKLVNNTR
ncbi:tRNA-dihydrouridine synthase 4 [Apiospora marii]|uniref:tRNA-dihydrouridine synthase 4 n=1 Tax=Apiospora marii TaxID=335849 RepID=UPI00312F7A07